MHRDPLPLLGQDEAKVLRLVERKHRGTHRFAGVSEKRRLGIRSHARFRHIGQAGSAPVMLIPHPHAPQRNCAVPRWRFGRTPHLHLRTDKASAFARTVFALECLLTLAVELQSSARDVRGGAGSAIDETARPLIHPGALPSVSTPTSGVFPTARHRLSASHPESSHADKTSEREGDDPAHQRQVPRRTPFHAFLNGGSSCSGFVTGFHVRPAPNSRDRTIEAEVTRDPVG
jgi:hypothetical protein